MNPPEVSSEQLYQVKHAGQNYGPYTKDQIQRHADDGRYDEGTLVWAEGMQDWVSITALVRLPPPRTPSSSSSNLTIAPQAAPPTIPSDLKYKCPDCGQPASKNAVACPNCGAQLKKSTSNGIAAVLTFFIPGLGQLYQGRILAGLILFTMVAIGLFLFVVPGIIMWLIAIIDTFTYKPKSRVKKA